MAFIEPMHRNKPNITYLLTYSSKSVYIEIIPMAQNTRGLYESNLVTKLTLNYIVLCMRKIMQNGLIDIKLDIYCTLHNRETLVLSSFVSLETSH